MVLMAVIVLSYRIKGVAFMYNPVCAGVFLTWERNRGKGEHNPCYTLMLIKSFFDLLEDFMQK